MKTRKRIPALLMALVMVLSLIPAAVWAAEESNALTAEEPFSCSFEGQPQDEGGNYYVTYSFTPAANGTYYFACEPAVFEDPEDPENSYPIWVDADFTLPDVEYSEEAPPPYAGFSTNGYQADPAELEAEKTYTVTLGCGEPIEFTAVLTETDPNPEVIGLELETATDCDFSYQNEWDTYFQVYSFTPATTGTYYLTSEGTWVENPDDPEDIWVPWFGVDYYVPDTDYGEDGTPWDDFCANGYDAAVLELESGKEYQIWVYCDMEAPTSLYLTTTDPRPEVVEATVGKDFKVDLSLLEEELAPSPSFTFTPAETGYYALQTNLDATYVAVINATEPEEEEEWIDPYIGGKWFGKTEDNKQLVIKLEKGVPYSFEVHDAVGSNSTFRIEKTVGVTGMELVKKPVIDTYLRGTYPYSDAMLEGAQLKMTLSDGTSETVTINYWRDMIYRDGYIEWMLADEDTGEAIVYYTALDDMNEAEVSSRILMAEYTLKVDNNYPVKVELVEGKDAYLLENCYGGVDEYDGTFWYEMDPWTVSGKTFLAKVTFADGSSKTFGPDDSLYGAFIEFRPDFTEDGKPSFRICFGEAQAYEFVPEVKKNNVKSVEILSGLELPLYGNLEYGNFLEDGTFLVDRKNISMRDLLNGLSFKVTYTDGTSKTFSYDQFTYSANDRHTELAYCDGFLVLPQENAEEGLNNSLTGPKSWKTTVYYMGQMKEITVNVTSAPVVVKKEEATVTESFVEEAITNATSSSSTSTGTVVLDMTASSGSTGEGEEAPAPVTTLTLPATSVESIVKNEKATDLTVVLTGATVSMDSAALAAISEQAKGEDISLQITSTAGTETLSDKQTAAVKEATANAEHVLVVSASLVSGGEKISDFKGGNVTLSVPFTPAEGTDGSEYVVVYIAEDGTSEIMKSEYKDGVMTFTTGHYSDFVIMKAKVAPPTGDTMSIALWGALMLTSAAAVLVLCKKRQSV